MRVVGLCSPRTCEVIMAYISQAFDAVGPKLFLYLSCCTYKRRTISAEHLYTITFLKSLRRIPCYLLRNKKKVFSVCWKILEVGKNEHSRAMYC